MDAVATAITEMVLSKEQLSPVVNVSHPNPVAWTEIFTHINTSFGGPPLRIVPFDQWLNAVEVLGSQGSPEDLRCLVSIPPSTANNALT
jgi:hypothetical protein